MRLLLKFSIVLFVLQYTFQANAQKTLGTTSIKNRPGVRKALLIGNRAYEMGRQLENTERDVDSMAKVLKNLGFEIVSHKNKDYRSSQVILEDFIGGLSKDRTEIVVFYFSGHGLGLGETNYLLPIDTRLSCIDQLKSYESLSLNHIVEGILAKGIKHNYFFIDACRDFPKVNNCDGSAAEAGRGLIKPLNKYTGAMISFATGAGQTADDDTYDKINSLYTSELIKYLPTRNINMHEMLKLVKNGVYLRSKHTQNPQYWEDVFDEYTLLPNKDAAKLPNAQGNSPIAASAAMKKISVMAYKPGGTDPDFEVIQMTMKNLKEKFPDYEVSQQMRGKGLSDDNLICTVTRKTTLKKNPVTINNETYDLMMADTQLNLIFRQGKEIKGEMELSEGGTDHNSDRAIKNSIEESLKKMKDMVIKFD